MTNIIFDTLAYCKKLKKVGVSSEQAEVHAEAMAYLVDEKLATKRDLQTLAYQLTIRFGSMLLAAVTILAIFIKIL